MTFLATVKEKLADRVAESIVASLTVLLGWIAYQIAPIVLPAIEAAISKRVLLAILGTSVALNVAFAIAVFVISKRDALRVKYGIYWDRDKNPHCPSCKSPIAGYDKYSSGMGYNCRPCNKVFRLTDVSGRDIDPVQAVSEL